MAEELGKEMSFWVRKARVDEDPSTWRLGPGRERCKRIL